MNKVAILIDGGFYLKRLPYVRRGRDTHDPEYIVKSIRQLVRGHLEKLSEIQRLTFYKPESEDKEFIAVPNWYAQHYRTFYYDAPPFKMSTERPISKEGIHYSTSPQYQSQLGLFDLLRKERNLALRLGEIRGNARFPWQLRPSSLEALLNGNKEISDLRDSDFTTTIRQKGVDMRLGLDMASIALKKQANIFVLVTGDADFVPAAKLVRREGCQVILDPMWQNVNTGLYEHIDRLDSAFPRPDGTS